MRTTLLLSLLLGCAPAPTLQLNNMSPAEMRDHWEANGITEGDVDAAVMRDLRQRDVAGADRWGE